MDGYGWHVWLLPEIWVIFDDLTATELWNNGAPIARIIPTGMTLVGRATSRVALVHNPFPNIKEYPHAVETLV